MKIIDFSHLIHAVAHPVQAAAHFYQQEVAAPIHRGVVGAVEAVNPYDAESRGNRLINDTNNLYQFTPAFKANLDQANPVVSQRSSLGDAAALQPGVKADGLYVGANNYEQHGIELASNGPFNKTALTHEGLHRVWDKDPGYKLSADGGQLKIQPGGARQDFIQAYQQGATPDLLNWLSRRTAGYKANQNVDVSQINKIPPSLLNEIHSYIPEYYATHPQVALDGPLADYYSRYFNVAFPQRQQEIYRVAGNAVRLVPRLALPNSEAAQGAR